VPGFIVMWSVRSLNLMALPGAVLQAMQAAGGRREAQSTRHRRYVNAGPRKGAAQPHPAAVDEEGDGGNELESLGVHSWSVVIKSSSVVPGVPMTMSSLKVVRGAPRSRDFCLCVCRALCDGARQGGCQSARRAGYPCGSVPCCTQRNRGGSQQVTSCVGTPWLRSRKTTAMIRE
jgi:hypothetical protein